MKTNGNLSTLLRGILRENPVLVLILGTCPTLATTTNVAGAFGMGIAAMCVLVCSNVLISLLRKIIPDQIRIAAYIVVIAGFVTMVDLLLQAYLPDIAESLGVFIPLIVVNCIILGRAESFASKNGIGSSAMDGIFQGIGYIFTPFHGADSASGQVILPANVKQLIRAAKTIHIKVKQRARFCAVPFGAVVAPS